MSQTPPVLDRLWEEIPTGRPPLDDLLAAGRARRRRRRTTAAMAGAVALVAGVGVATGLVRPDDSGTPEPSDTRVADPQAPPGYRLVGIGRVAIAVPETWAINAAGCNTPVEDTAFFPWGQDCVIPGPDSPVSSVAITTGGFSGTGPRLRALDAAPPVGGHRVVESVGVCATSLPGACTQAFGVPDLHAYFSVSIAGDADDPGGQLQAIRSSLRVLSHDERAVPSVAPFALLDADDGPARHQLESAGFAVEVRELACADNAFCASGTVTGTEPAAGTVVPAGSTVVLDVVG